MTRKRKKAGESLEQEVKKEVEKIIRTFEARKVYAAVVIVAAVFLVIGFMGSSISATANGSSAGTEEEIKAKVVDFINNNMIQSGSVSAESMGEVSGIYEINVSYQGQTIPVYVTKDGKMLIVQGIGILDLDMEAEEPEPEPQESPATCEDMPKSEAPVLDAFIVSYCPFGLQMQRILAEVEPLLGDNMNVRYIGYIENGVVKAMHGEEEAEENLRQICIREEQADRFWDYLKCFMKAGDVEGCLASTGVDTGELDACMGEYERGVTYASVDFGLQSQHGVSGSPTLIMNGERVSEFDFGGRTAEAVKTLLCCGFTQEPGVCSQQLTTEKAATGFSETYTGTGAGSSGSC